MSVKINITQLIQYAESKSGKLLDTCYISNHYKYLWECQCGYQWKASWVNVRNGHWCPKCAGQVVDLSKLNEYAQEKGGMLTSSLHEYQNNSSKLKWKCAKNHEWYANWRNIQSGKWCPKCAKNRKPTHKRIQQVTTKHNGKLLSTYDSAKAKMEWECERGHKFQANWNNVSSGKWCPQCAKAGFSQAELDLLHFVQNYYPDARKSNLQELAFSTDRREIDIYIPSRKIAIEYDGLYWHTEDSKEPRLADYHFSKYKTCLEAGVQLITIFEDEWIYRNNQVKNFLKSVLGACTNVVYARDCAVQTVDLPVAKEFMNTHHIQGYSPSITAVGLYYQEQLIGLMTVGLHHRNSSEVVLNRFVIKEDFHVPGGASRLLKYIEQFTKVLGYSRIISWSDNRWSLGRVYEKLQFTLEAELAPDYAYVDLSRPVKRISKQSCKKSELVKKGAFGKTEYEMARSLNYSRIWDCGKKRWVKILF